LYRFTREKKLFLIVTIQFLAAFLSVRYTCSIETNVAPFKAKWYRIKILTINTTTCSRLKFKSSLGLNHKESNIWIKYFSWRFFRVAIILILVLNGHLKNYLLWQTSFTTKGDDSLTLNLSKERKKNNSSTWHCKIVYYLQFFRLWKLFPFSRNSLIQICTFLAAFH
jgi:hypothetical protein